LYSSPDIIRITKSKQIRWMRHVAYMENKINAYKIVVGTADGVGTTRSI
jgi:hypothetical protein